MNCTDTTKTYIADVKVTTQTYKLYRDVLSYDDGTEIAHYVLRSVNVQRWLQPSDIFR